MEERLKRLLLDGCSYYWIDGVISGCFIMSEDSSDYCRRGTEKLVCVCVCV